MLLLLGLSACSDNDSKYSYTYNLNPINIITNVSDGTSYASEGRYSFELTSTPSSNTGVITVSNLLINNSLQSFTTFEQPYKTNLYFANFENVETDNANVSDANFLLTPYFNYPAYFNIIPTYQSSGDIVLAKYRYGDYEVKTFQKNTFFVGTTETTYPFQGQNMSASSETIYYQLVIDIAENPQKATLIMYNAKFSGVEQEPVKKQINLEDLDVTYANGLITVTGENIIPDIVEGSAVTPNPDYIFDNIEFKTISEDLTWCSITFKVRGIYNGSFRGSYADSSKR